MATGNADDEVRMLQIWADALQVSDIALDDDLIDLGGDSLTAMTMVSRIAADFGVELELWDLLDAGTPRRLLATVVATRDGAAAEAS